MLLNIIVKPKSFLMKSCIKLLCSSALILFCTIINTSCKKENQTQIINNTDTLYIDTPITTALISSRKWMIEEMRAVYGGSIVYYLRGGSTNTQNFDDEYYQLNSDLTGGHQETSIFQRPVTWNFLNANNTKLVIHLTNTPANFDVIWDNIRIKNGKLYYDEYFTDGNSGLNSHGQYRRIPKP